MQANTCKVEIVSCLVEGFEFLTCHLQLVAHSGNCYLQTQVHVWVVPGAWWIWVLVTNLSGQDSPPPPRSEKGE